MIGDRPAVDGGRIAPPVWKTVTVAIPVWNEEAHIDHCLDAVAAQTYPGIVEVLVVDGGSTDRTRQHVVAKGGGVRLVDNPRRIQAAALNIALGEAKGEVFVRVDGHCLIAPDYVERCVDVLDRYGAAIAGGAMRPVAQTPVARGIAAAMMSPVGAGPARFHVGGSPAWVDTVYLGAYRTALAIEVGGYRENVGVNEDAEFAIRMRGLGGIRFDPSILSSYAPRSSLQGLARQFYRYGRSRAATVRQHPTTFSPRQMAAPLLLLGLASPWRRSVAGTYGSFVLLTTARQALKDPGSAGAFGLSLPAMHLPWAAGFLRGLASRDYHLGRTDG